MRRRDFLGAAATEAAFAAGIMVRPRRTSADPVDAALAAGPKSNAPRMPRREYGKTGIQLSIVGFPGYALRDSTDQAFANRLVAESFDRGVNYFDVAADYGHAEELVGPALRPYRKDVFLSSKTARRTAPEAAANLKRSLERLRTDHLDLYNLHHIKDMDKDVDVAFGKGGAMEVLIQAKKEGRVRFLGFSAHSIEAGLAALDRYDFDSAIFPINFACMTTGDWGQQLIDKCREKDVAMFALKALARQQWPENDPKRDKYPICWYQPVTDLDEAELAFRYTLSQPIVAALSPSSDRLHRLAMMLATDYRPLQPAEQDTAKRLAASLNPVFSRS